jgi:hypothetical protein
MEIAEKPSRARCFLRIVLPFVLVIGAHIASVDGGQGSDKRGDFLFSPKKTFQHYCSPCHGLTGEGDGRYYASGLTPKPADLTAKEISARDEAYLFKWISRGSAATGKSNLCPPWGKTIQEEHIRGIIAHLKTLSQESKD